MCNKKIRFRSAFNRYKGAVHTEQAFKYKCALYLRRHSKAKHDRPSEWSTLCTCELFYGLLYTVAVYIVFLGKLWFKKCLAGLFGNFYIFVTFLDICRKVCIVYIDYISGTISFSTFVYYLYLKYVRNDIHVVDTLWFRLILLGCNITTVIKIRFTVVSSFIFSTELNEYDE